MSSNIGIEIDQGVALLTMNNPPLNVATLQSTRQFNEALDGLASNGEVLVLVVRGSGERAFSAGSDISEFPDYLAAGNVVEKKLRYENETMVKLERFPKPTVAALNGLAFGGGLELAVCCDLIVADETANLALPEIKLGVFPGSGGTLRVTRRVGPGRAKEMMFLGEPISAAQALEWGLVNRVAAKGQATYEALALARELAARPNIALQACKKAIDEGAEMPDDEAIEQVLSLMEKTFASDDGQEGVRAFFAKEEPKFKHS
ncbi:MAG: enoyl-CoA hydratase/isomerase family protein [Rhodospirillaceae bacterium]|jgi:enoyl-CoA hydratase/carnithine racemase|nr:enoyl-CoA hydratase/isomerase family protein [Rhodospirillaceae bacterium]MBT3495364.1 enoyl-CoA hydratase/isomerase family protein [Rhodospirillaceae bacterium]MBT3778761.1 enoyl-CoA hydratase/isomerase family protein [Rhodospirillaceae bacterium]MBT3975593.1 enoyl-CoA hydratase/isomerase family protein [Rhodospirillaceae bacterium]MBT4169515.1 enoyl-CoA hydratase/isomerase family protein [Rhodospirillaceae bacterium]